MKSNTSKILFYNTNGIISDKPLTPFFIEERFGHCAFPNIDKIDNLDFTLVNTYYDFEKKIFRDEIEIEAISRMYIVWLTEFGIDAEHNISKEDFSKIFKCNIPPVFNRIMLLYDIYSIISSIQNRLLETKGAIINFYKQLCSFNNSLTGDMNTVWSIETTMIHSIAENIIIKLYSIFDLSTKLVIESISEYDDFSKWPSLKSKNKLYKDNKIFYDETWKNTIYEKSQYITLMINLRNEIIHNGSLHEKSKIFHVIENNTVTEKIIYLQDHSNGIIDRVNNRNKFYSKDYKLNQELPIIYFDVIDRIGNTFNILRKSMNDNI